eukprot:Em0013g710a
MEREDKAPQTSEPPQKKRGPKPSGECGVVPKSKTNNTKVPYSLLCLLAGMIVAQYNAGFPLSSTLLMPMVLGFFEVHKISWVPSKMWYRRFLLKIGLKYRAITKTSCSLPVDFTTIKRMFLRRVVFVVRKYSIPPSLFLNIDETGVNLLPSQKRTWGPSGAKQISVLGWGDKQQFTVIPAITAEESTILEYVAVLYATYVLPKMAEERVDPVPQKWVLLWDCYSVYRSGPVLDVLKRKYPNLVLLFVPASCTAELQPLDLSYNFAFKTGVATLFASWLSQVAQEQLLRGVSQDQLTFDLSLKSVKTPFVKWVYMTLNKMSESKKSAMADGWRVSGISVSWATTDEDIEERDTLYEEARALEKQKELFVVKGERSKDAAVARLIEQTVVEGSSKRKRDEMVEGTSGKYDNGRQRSRNWMMWKAKKTRWPMERSRPNYPMS